MWVVLLAVVALAVIGEASFDRPLRRVQEFRLDESTAGIGVRITGSSSSAAAPEDGERLELQEILSVELLRSDGTSRPVSPALLFEVLAAEPRMLQSVMLGGENGSTLLAPTLESSAFEYRCCGEDSAILVRVGPTSIAPEVRANPVLTFEVVPSTCVYDQPKVFCRFATLESAGPIVVDGGSILLSDFGGLDLRGAVFLNVDLRGTSFVGADLRGALFKNVNLVGVDFMGAQLDQTILRNIESDDLLGRP